MSSRSRWIILSLALIGLGFASYSAFVHYKILTDASYSSPCDINETFSCSQVYLSQYGSVAGVPVALLGVFYFGLVALVAFSSRPAQGKASDTPGGSYLFALSTIGLAVVLYLGYTSWFVLKHLCVLCMGTYAAVLGIFIASGSASTVAVRELPARLGTDIKKSLADPFPLALLAALLVSVGLAVGNFPAEGTVPGSQTSSSSAPDETFAAAWARMPRIDLGVPANGAKVVIVKFNDFQCPPCGQTYGWYKPVLAKFEQTNPGAVRMVLKDWPWNTKCNFGAANGPNHAGACEAAAAYRMARDQGPAKELEMEDWLYGNQATLAPDTVKAAVDRILGIKDFDRQYLVKLEDIKKDVADGMALRIQGTPTLFINGVRVVSQGLMPASYLEMAIQLELNRAAGK